MTGAQATAHEDILLFACKNIGYPISPDEEQSDGRTQFGNLFNLL